MPKSLKLKCYFQLLHSQVAQNINYNQITNKIPSMYFFNTKKLHIEKRIYKQLQQPGLYLKKCNPQFVASSMLRSYAKIQAFKKEFVEIRFN